MMELSMIPAAGGVFYCHKGVPIETDPDGTGDTHRHPKLENGEHDRKRMRVCAGFMKCFDEFANE